MMRLIRSLPPTLGGWIAALLTIGVLYLVGELYAWALTVAWPLIGFMAAVGSHRSGFWNYGDPGGEQFFNGMLHIVMPPVGTGILAHDLLEYRRAQF